MFLFFETSTGPKSFSLAFNIFIDPLNPIMFSFLVLDIYKFWDLLYSLHMHSVPLNIYTMTMVIPSKQGFVSQVQTLHV